MCIKNRETSQFDALEEGSKTLKYTSISGHNRGFCLLRPSHLHSNLCFLPPPIMHWPDLVTEDSSSVTGLRLPVGSVARIGPRCAAHGAVAALLRGPIPADVFEEKRGSEGSAARDGFFVWYLQ